MRECVRRQVDFYEEATAESLGGLPREVNWTRLLVVVSKRMREEKR